MTKYIALYEKWDWGVHCKLVIPFESNLTLNQLQNYILDIAYKRIDVNISTVFTEISEFLETEEILEIELYKLSDWFTENKQIVSRKN